MPSVGVERWTVYAFCITDRGKISHRQLFVRNVNLVFSKTVKGPCVHIIRQVPKGGRANIHGHVPSSIISHWGVSAPFFFISPCAFWVIGFELS